MTAFEEHARAAVSRARHLDRRKLLGGILGTAATPWLFGRSAPANAAASEATAGDARDAVTVVKDDLVAGGHILSNENIIDAFGHISARHPTKPDHFLMSRARAPGLSVVADIMEFDGNGDAVDAQGRRGYLERYIHAGIYRLRSDVRSVVHHHSREVVPFSVSTVPLRPLGHTGGVIGGSVPVWDIREHFGESTNMLVSSLEMGLDLARRLGQGSTLLMRGHGAAIAAQSVRLATFIAISLDTQAREQREAMSLGPINPLSPGEVAATSHLYDPGEPGDAMNRAWEYWCLRAGVPFHPRGA
jgi:ribulose-5-phosphate 4-epimerase/fuculose-1-phosphate aldolase